MIFYYEAYQIDYSLIKISNEYDIFLCWKNIFIEYLKYKYILNI